MLEEYFLSDNAVLKLYKNMRQKKMFHYFYKALKTSVSVGVNES